MNKQAILDEIRKASMAVLETEVPEGCITFAEIEQTLGCGHGKAQRLMARLVTEGKFERVELGGRIKVVFRKIESKAPGS